MVTTWSASSASRQSDRSAVAISVPPRDQPLAFGDQPLAFGDRVVPGKLWCGRRRSSPLSRRWMLSWTARFRWAARFALEAGGVLILQTFSRTSLLIRFWPRCPFRVYRLGGTFCFGHSGTPFTPGHYDAGHARSSRSHTKSLAASLGGAAVLGRGKKLRAVTSARKYRDSGNSLKAVAALRVDYPAPSAGATANTEVKSGARPNISLSGASLNPKA